MKKLMMFAATMTIVGGAFAQCGDLPEIPAERCALVYDVKASLKTTAAKSATSQEECSDPTVVCYRVPASLSAKGFMYDCDCCIAEAATLLVWFGKSDTAYNTPAGWPILNIIGKKSTDAEGYLVFGSMIYDGFAFQAAGFGKAKDLLLSSLSGQIVGIVEPPWCSADCAEGTASVALPFCDFIPTDDVMDVATGTWSMKFNKSMSEDVVTTHERLVLAGKLPKQIKYISQNGEVMTVAAWVAEAAE